MTESRPDRLVNKIVIRGRIEDIWRELTKNNEPQAAVFNAWLHAQRLAPGAKLQMRTGDGKFVLVIGDVLEFDPPRRFAHTFRFTQYDDPPCTVIYELTPVPGGVEVSLIVENVPVGTRTAKAMTSGGVTILKTLKTVDRNWAAIAWNSRDVLDDGPDELRLTEALPRRSLASAADHAELALPVRSGSCERHCKAARIVRVQSHPRKACAFQHLTELSGVYL